jgi:hypothetical protein
MSGDSGQRVWEGFPNQSNRHIVGRFDHFATSCGPPRVADRNN